MQGAGIECAGVGEGDAVEQDFVVRHEFRRLGVCAELVGENGGEVEGRVGGFVSGFAGTAHGIRETRHDFCKFRVAFELAGVVADDGADLLRLLVAGVVENAFGEEWGGAGVAAACGHSEDAAAGEHLEFPADGFTTFMQSKVIDQPCKIIQFAEAPSCDE